MKRFAFLCNLKVLIGGGIFVALAVFLTFFLFIPQADIQGESLANKPAEVTPLSTTVPVSTTVPPATVLPTTTTPASTPVPTQTVPVQAEVPFIDRFNYREKDVVEQVKPGLIHILRSANSSGPLKINILLFDISQPQFDLRVVMKDGYLNGVSRTTDLLKANNGIAAVNGDLFSGVGLPQGLVISDGKLTMAPKHRATFAWTKDREPYIGYFTDEWTWIANVTASNGNTHSIQLLNTPCQDNWLCIYNDMFGEVGGRPTDFKAVIGPDNTVEEINNDGKQYKIKEGYKVLLARQGTEAFDWLKANAVVGESLKVRTSDYSLFQQAVSGGPIFLQNGQFIQDCLCELRNCKDSKVKGLFCEDFTNDWKLSHYLTTRMPRTGIGYDDKKDYLMVAQVDGYQPGFSVGMTQQEFADLFVEFGVTSAMELDGGGSSTMALGGKLVSHPSDGNGTVERWVPNAVVFYWNDQSQLFSQNQTTGNKN